MVEHTFDLYLFKPQAGRCLERENMSDGVRLAVFATIAESHGFNPWECVNFGHPTCSCWAELSEGGLGGAEFPIGRSTGIKAFVADAAAQIAGVGRGADSIIGANFAQQHQIAQGLVHDLHPQVGVGFH
jgi:hypothetical protein